MFSIIIMALSLASWVSLAYQVDLQSQIDELEKRMTGEFDEQTKLRLELARDIYGRLGPLDDMHDMKDDIQTSIKKIDENEKTRNQQINELWRHFHESNEKIAKNRRNIWKANNILSQQKKRACVSDRFRVETDKSRGSTTTTVPFVTVKFERKPTVMAAIAGIKHEGDNFKAQTWLTGANTTSAQITTSYSWKFNKEFDGFIDVAWMACQ